MCHLYYEHSEAGLSRTGISETCYNVAMRLLQSHVFLLTPFFSMILSAPAFCAAPPALTLVPGDETVVINARAARCEFSARSLSNQEPLKHTFEVHNGTRKTLTIERIGVSCECVQAAIGEEKLPVHVLPGQTVPVRVTLSVRRLVPGHFSRSATLYLHGGDTTSLRLEMSGILTEGNAPLAAAPVLLQGNTQWKK